MGESSLESPHEQVRENRDPNVLEEKKGDATFIAGAAGAAVGTAVGKIVDDAYERWKARRKKAAEEETSRVAKSTAEAQVAAAEQWGRIISAIDALNHHHAVGRFGPHSIKLTVSYDEPEELQRLLREWERSMADRVNRAIEEGPTSYSPDTHHIRAIGEFGPSGMTSWEVYVRGGPLQ